MELREALTQISEIRATMARTETFRGYRALPVAFSGLLALAAAGFQAIWLTEPLARVDAYLALWVGTAALSALACGSEMVLHARLAATRWSREITWLAIGQFLPCLAAGGFVTVVLVQFAPETVWMLPGLWQVLFSLGIFASCRLLPRATFGVAVFYLGAGLASLVLARGDAALSPWAMGLPFGVGQLLTALVLYRTLECHDVQR